jgi:hypothetical protein
MLILKRLVVWFLETSCGALLLGLFLVVYFGPGRNGFIRDLLVAAGAIALLSVTTGYVLTTALFRSILSTQRLWLYPIVASILFFVHTQIFFVATGAFTPSRRLLIRAAGASVVFACTFAGTFALQKWGSTSTK